MSDTWKIQRLARGSGKARWHTIAAHLSEYEAKTFGRDASQGSRGWHYRLISPAGKHLELWPTGAWVNKHGIGTPEMEYNWVERRVIIVGKPHPENEGAKSE